jgi:hypothetical protein
MLRGQLAEEKRRRAQQDAFYKEQVTLSPFLRIAQISSILGGQVEYSACVAKRQICAIFRVSGKQFFVDS